MPQQLINEIGNRYGLLTVKELTKDKNGRTAWLCQCDCGNVKIARGSDLRKGKITACGSNCKLKYLRNGNFKDLTGQKFGRLTVLNFKEINNNHKSVWHCKCDCGNECDVIGAQIVNGSIQSCGCLHREQLQQQNIQDITGQTFGYLTVLNWIYDENKKIKWRCKCKCGNIVDYPAKVLTAYNGAKSCGCIKSSYEIDIQNYLKKQNIEFKKEQSFEDLVSQKNRRLRYDFGIYKNNQIIGLIEFQGDQHFQNVDYFGGEKEFEKRQLHDILKLLYAKDHNIPLLYLVKEDNLKEKINHFLKEINYYEI